VRQIRVLASIVAIHGQKGVKIRDKREYNVPDRATYEISFLYECAEGVQTNGRSWRRGGKESGGQFS